MDTQAQEVNDNIQDMIKERQECLPNIISSFNEIDNYTKLLDNIKVCTKYLSTYDLSDINVELLQYVMPVLRKGLEKIYEDNFLLSDTVSDEFVLNIIKDNLQVALGFLQFIKSVLDFLSQSNEVNLSDLNKTAIDMAFIILITFEHCNNSTDDYKNAFNGQLLDVFRNTQDIHLLFLRLLELNVVIISEPSSLEEIRLLSGVLDTMCNMSDPLSNMNIKSMTDSWKSYVAITQKFSILLSEARTNNLKLPIQRLTSQIYKNLFSISLLTDSIDEKVDVKFVSQVIKITSFLIKVALKLCDIFFNCLEENRRDILNFCCTIYSFPVGLYRCQGYASDILEHIEILGKSLEPFLLRMSNDPIFVKIFSSENLLSCEHSLGLVCLLSYVLKLLVLNEQKFTNFKVDHLISGIFKSVSQCYVEFFWPAGVTESIFDHLVLHITAVVLVYDECYIGIERILFENLLQDHIWSALLALDVWTLLLSKSPPMLRLETLTNLVKQHRIIGFGIYTTRPEEVYMKCMMQRVFRMLPGQMKNDVVSRYSPVSNIKIWRMIQFRDFPICQRLMIEEVSMAAVENIAMLKRGDLRLKDLTILAEHLEVLSTANFNGLGLSPSKLANAVYGLWEFNINSDGIVTNNLFRYFFGKLCKITGAVMEEYSNAQLITLLTHLKILSYNEEYRLLVCDVLSAVSRKTVDYSHELAPYQIRSLIVDTFQHNLLSATKGVIKQNALEAIHNFALNNKHDIVKNISRNSKETQAEISDYLNRHIPGVVPSGTFDKEYIAMLGSFKFRHQCVTWKRDVVQPRLKKIKIDEVLAETASKAKEKQTHLGMKAFKGTAPLAEADANVIIVEDKAEHVSEVLNNIKGEVKCLLGILKTEKLSRKNASDIRLIANQLLSL